MGEGNRGVAGVTGLEGRRSWLGPQPCPKADPGRARPPELSLLPCPLCGQSHVPPLSLGPPSPAQCWPGLGAAGSGAFFVEWVVAEVCAAHRLWGQQSALGWGWSHGGGGAAGAGRV